MTPLRLVIVVGRFWPLVGSAESNLVRLARALEERNCRVTFVTWRWHPAWPQEILFYGMRVVRLDPPPEGRLNIWRAMQSLARWVRLNEDEFDLVYVDGLRHEAYAVVRALHGRRPIALAPTRSGRRGDCVMQLDAPCGRRIKNQCLRADAFLASTPAIRRDMEAAGYSRNRIHDASFGILPLPVRTGETRAAARAILADANPQLQLGDDARLAVSMGRIADGRGWENIVAAWSSVVRDLPGARLWFAGEASNHLDLEQRISRFGLTARVAAQGVFDEVEILLEAADLFVTMTPDEAPVSILESMAAGLPCVAADVSVNRWLLTDERDGLLSLPDDPAAIAAAILRILTDPGLASRLGTAARERAIDDFPLAKKAEDHLTLFHRLCDRRADCQPD